MQFTFRATLEKDPDGGYFATFKDVPEALAYGATKTAALDEAKSALSQGLRTYSERDRAMPQPLSTHGYPVTIPGHDALKLAVLDAFTSAGMTKTQLARKLGKTENEARRILDPDHATKTPMLEAALEAMGKRIIILVEEIA